MAFALLIVSTFIVAELFIRLPIIDSVRRSSVIAAKSAILIRADKISDHWKERVLPAYAGALFLQTLRLSAMIALAFAPVLVALAISQLVNVPLMSLFVSIPGMVLSVTVAAAYAFVRLRFVS